MALPLVYSVGCQSTKTNFINDDDRLRQENLALHEKIDELHKTLATERSRVDALEQRLDDRASRPDVPASVLLRLSSVEFDRYTGAIDQDGDGHDDALRLYIHTLDQHGRFMLCVGQAVVQAVTIEPGHPAQVVAEETFDPQAFDGCFRSGLTGTHYSLEVPLPQPLPEALNEVTVKITLTDAATGVVLTHAQPMKIQASR